MFPDNLFSPLSPCPASVCLSVNICNFLGGVKNISFSIWLLSWSHIQKHVYVSWTSLNLYIPHFNVFHHGDPLKTPVSGFGKQGKVFPILKLSDPRTCLAFVLHSWPERASLVAQLVKNLPAVQILGSIPGLERSLGNGNGYPLQYSGLENSMDCISSSADGKLHWYKPHSYFKLSRYLARAQLEGWEGWFCSESLSWSNLLAPSSGILLLLLSLKDVFLTLEREEGDWNKTACFTISIIKPGPWVHNVKMFVTQKSFFSNVLLGHQNSTLKLSTEQWLVYYLV